ncbi:MAG: hypothetical protein ABI835_09695, partial [Chloroflexota bacterium]
VALMQTETIFGSYEPIRKYNDLLRTSGAEASAVQIQPIDSFLIKQLIAYYPAAPLVIDFASDLTGGASTFLLTACPDVRHVYTANTHAAAVQSAFKALGVGDFKTTFLDAAPDEPEQWQTLSAALDPFAPPLFLLALDEKTANTAAVAARLEHLATLVPEPVVLVLPIGALGTSPILEGVLRLCAVGSVYRFSALRELNPFWAGSQVGVITRKQNTVVADILKRLAQLYQGNFDFVTLLEAHLGAQIRENIQLTPEMELEIKRLSVKQPAELAPSPPPSEPTRKERLQAAYRGAIPLRLRLLLRDARFALLRPVRR